MPLTNLITLPVKGDRRYLIHRTHAGKSKATYLAWFCHIKLGFFDTHDEAIDACLNHKQNGVNHD